MSRPTLGAVKDGVVFHAVIRLAPDDWKGDSALLGRELARCTHAHKYARTAMDCGYRMSFDDPDRLGLVLDRPGLI